MARKRVKRKRKKSNRKIKANSAHASLCALTPLITGRQIFDHIHQEVTIPQKKDDTTEERRYHRRKWTTVPVTNWCLWLLA